MLRSLTIVAALAMAVSSAAADDISDAIDDAAKAYKAGDLGGAKQSLDLASQLIAQKSAEGLVKVLPKPLPGWTAEDADTTTSGMAFIAGSNASRRYANAKDDSVTVAISADGPMVVQMATMLSNPQIAGSMGKVIRIGDQRAIQERGGDLTLVVANRFLVKVDGSASADDKLAYAKAIDYAQLLKVK